MTSSVDSADRSQWRLHIEGISVRDANILAAELRDVVLDADPSIEIELQRENPASMDSGSMLAIVLGAPSVIILARAIHTLATRIRPATLKLSGRDGNLVATNLQSKDVAEIVAAFKQKAGRESSK